MVNASLLRAGMAIRFEGQPYKVVACEYHPGQGKMGGTAHTRLKESREEELRALTAPQVREALAEASVKLVSFREL